MRQFDQSLRRSSGQLIGNHSAGRHAHPGGNEHGVVAHELAGRRGSNQSRAFDDAVRTVNAGLGEPSAVGVGRQSAPLRRGTVLLNEVLGITDLTEAKGPGLKEKDPRECVVADGGVDVRRPQADWA